MLISAMIRHCARTYGDRVAYVDGDRSRTWSEIDQRTDRLAAALQSRGVRNGDVSVILSQDRLEVLEHWFACLKIGAVRVGANFRYSPHEVAHVIRDSGATSVLVEAECADLLAEALPVLQHEGALVVGFGGEHHLGEDFEALVRDGGVPTLAHPADSDTAAIAYTAGTTGSPKGVVWTHGGMREGMKWLIINVGLRNEDIWVNALPAAAGPLIFVSMNVVNGMTSVLPGGRFDPARFLSIIAEHRATATMLVPTMLQDVLTQLRANPSDTSSLRLLCYGSMSTTPSVIRHARESFGCEVQQWYGSTEMTGIAAILRDADHALALEGAPGVLASCGKPMMHVDIEIRSAEGRLLGPDEPGEVWIRSETLFAGYHNRATETADALADGWFRPGDIGKIDRSGYLYILDRKNFMIISGGYNVYPTIVESTLAEHDSVREVAVVGAPHPRWGEAPVAVVTLQAGHSETVLVLDELRALGDAKLAKWERPRHIEIVADLPRGATGKVDRRRIRDRFRAESDRLPW